MNESGRAYFKDVFVGSITRLKSDGSFQFQYEPNAKTISLTMPSDHLLYESVNLFPFFDGLIPEGWLLNLVSKNWKIDVKDRMALLLTTCQDCIGAAHILTEASAIADSPNRSNSTSQVPTNSDSTTRCLVCMQDLGDGEILYHKKCARDLFGFSPSPAIDVSLDHLEQLALAQINQRLTLTGVQKKLSLTAIAGDDQKTRLTVLGFEGGYILKPPCEEYPEMPEIEHLSMKLAELQELRVARCGLVFLTGGERAYITRRFDRAGKEKIEMEDFCQLSGKPTAMKYTGSTEGLGKIIDRFSSQSSDDKLTLFQMIVFSFWIGNTDMHLKNFSLWRDPESQSIRLSPCYDLLSTRMLISKKEDREELALPVNAKKNNLRWSDFVALGTNFKIPLKVQLAVRDRIVELSGASESLVSQSFLTDERAEKFRELLREHTKRLTK